MVSQWREMKKAVKEVVSPTMPKCCTVVLARSRDLLRTTIQFRVLEVKLLQSGVREDQTGVQNRIAELEIEAV